MKIRATLSFLATLLTFNLTAQQVFTVAPPFNGSGGVTVSDSGIVYIGDFGDALGFVQGGTHILRYYPTTGIVDTFAQQQLGASGNCFDSQGNFYQSNIQANRIRKVTPAGVVTTYVTQGISNPVGVTMDDNDNLYVCNCGNNTIRKVTPGGVSTTFSSGGLFACPNGITIDENDNLYVSNFSNGDVIKITPTGNASVFTTINGGNNGHLTYRNGYLFVASHGASRIYVVGQDQTPIALAGTGIRGNDDGPAASATFSKPNGISPTLTGDTLYVNCAQPTVPDPNNTLNPTLLRMITGVNGFITALGIDKIDATKTATMKVIPNPTKGITRVQVEASESQSVQAYLYNM